jgi:hypothetical protein
MVCSLFLTTFHLLILRQLAGMLRSGEMRKNHHEDFGYSDAGGVTS